MKKIIVIVIFLSSVSLFSQVKITGYFDAKIGLNYQFSDKFQVELRANDNLKSEFNTELSLLYKFISKENYNLNTGLGVSTFPFYSDNLFYFDSIYIPIQIEITPFNSAKNLAFVLESAYHFSDLVDGSGIRNSVGIRYIFKS